MKNFIDDLCYRTSNTSFIWWGEADFGLCLQNVALVSLTSVLFAMASGFYATWMYTSLQRKRRPIVLLVRVVICVCLALNSVAGLVVSLFHESKRPNSITLSASIVIVTWLTHAGCVFVLSSSIRYYGHGLYSLNTLWFFTAISSCFQFRTYLRHNDHPGNYEQYEDIYFSIWFEVCVYVNFSLQCLYALTIVVPVDKVEGYRDIKLPEYMGNHFEGHEMRRSLISSGSSYSISGDFSSYGAIPTDNVELTVSTLKEAQEDNANLLSRLFFYWVHPLMVKGSLGRLEKPEDLPPLPRSLNTEEIRNKFHRILFGIVRESDPSPSAAKMVRSIQGNPYQVYSENTGIQDPSMPKEDKDDEEVDRCSLYSNLSTLQAGETEHPITLFRALNKAFGWHYYPLGIVRLINDILGFAGPLLLHALVSFMENNNEPEFHGYCYAAGLFLTTFLGALLNLHFTYQINKVGMKVRAAIITAVYHKALHVSSTELSQFSTGEVVNFMSTDTDRIVNFCPSFHQFWSLPFQIAVSLYLLYQQVGKAFLAGLVFTILLIPINRWLAVKIGKLSNEMMIEKDGRVQLMSEILHGIRVIKLWAWENIFSRKVDQYRSKELEKLKGRKYLDALCVYFWATTPVLISILTFSAYVAFGNKLTAAKVFTSIALFNILIGPLNAFPWVINGLMEARVSLKRIQSFLSMETQNLLHYYTMTKPPNCTEGPADIILCDSHFSWKHQKRPTTSDDDVTDDLARSLSLSDISLTILPGQFVGVIGKVGCGKSSLLAAITAEMNITQGEVYVARLSEGFGLATQESWIQNATVRDNILFGMPFIPEKYFAIIKACALEPDLQILPAGDMTEVGENGVTLSGGQKARISLARAIYQDKLVYLLDDPLAAVDVHVANHLYTHCIMGLLQGKTRILCTHHVNYLQEADTVIVLDNGTLKYCGQPSAVLPLVAAEEGNKETAVDSESDPKQKTESSSAEEDPTITDKGKDKDDDGELVKEEEKDVGVVAFSVYQSYWFAVGSLLAPLILLSLFLMQASRNISDWWLAYWISHTHKNLHVHNNLSWVTGQGDSPYTDTMGGSYPLINITSAEDNLAFYLGIYGGLAAANSVFTLFRAFLYAYGGIRAATVMHKKLLNSILKASVTFFDTNPIGRIVNRFSSDLYTVDDSLPFILNILLAQVYAVVGTIAVTCYGLPWFTVLLVPIVVFYYHIQRYYRRTSRELKRLSTVTLSPVYAHFSESLDGLPVIRAMRESERFADENQSRLEINQRANFGGYAASQWLSSWLQMLGVTMVTGVAFIAVLEHHLNSVDPGLVGLAISYALSVTNLLSGVVTSFTETEKQMVSVERMCQYIGGVPSEQQGGIRQLPSWPSAGAVEFKLVVLVYRSGLPASLKDVSFMIHGGEKIGVVGRTGAGKSSLFQALFRMVELTSGSILIDNVDISTLSLHLLRMHLAIIPQDPFLFGGTIRDNLDPSHQHDDVPLWNALKRCHLNNVVERIGGLDVQVSERGRSFSVGERQLFCLARALLRKAKIVCLDEATASVDLQTSAAIIETIRTEFEDSTVITIAHRIETVYNSDRIIVMDKGRVKEFGPPQELLNNPRSFFKSLVQTVK